MKPRMSNVVTVCCLTSHVVTLIYRSSMDIFNRNLSVSNDGGFCALQLEVEFLG